MTMKFMAWLQCLVAPFTADSPACASGSDGGLTYTNSDNTTELVVSVGGNGDVKISAGNGDSSDNEVTTYITDCLAGGNEVDVSWETVDGGTGTVSLLPNVTNNPFPNFYNDSENATGVSGKLTSLTAVCKGVTDSSDKYLRVSDACLLQAIKNMSSGSVIEGCKTVDGKKLSYYTKIDDKGNAMFPIRPLTDLGFDDDCCESITSDSTTGTSDPTDGFTPGAGALVSDNFQDGAGNAPFNLQVRNTTGNPVLWAAEIVNVPYATIPSLSTGGYNASTTDNGDGTYTHLFTGTSSLGPYANVIITGGVPSPAGDGSGLELYIQ